MIHESRPRLAGSEGAAADACHGTPVTAREVIPLGECGLLTCKNAMRYCGQLGDERFDREVAPCCRPRLIGQERFYLREDLDAGTRSLPVDRLGGTPQAATWGRLGKSPP